MNAAALRALQRIVPAAVAAILFGSCLFETAPREPGSDHKLRYTLSVAGTDTVRCRVSVRIIKWPKGEPLFFQAPTFYTDNPLLPVRGFHARDFTAEDSAGRPLPVRDTVPAYEDLDGNFLVMPPETRVVSYSVDHDPADPKRFGLPLPGLVEGAQAIDGAYFFILPVRGDRFSAQWRNPVAIHLDIDPGGGRLVGQDPSIDFTDNYELMFVRAVVNPLRTWTFKVGNHDVTTYTTTRDTVDMDKFNASLAQSMELVEDSLMPLPLHNWFAGEVPVFWGIEGSQGYWFRPEAQSLAYVHTHELTHTFVGVRHGELDDPWWKEGVTNYIGELLALQAGIYAESLFVRDFTAPRDTLPAIRDYALSHPYVRNHLFMPLDTGYQSVGDARDFISLVYDKGGEAAMIIDRRILEGSNGKKSLFDLVRLLVSRHGDVFGREDLIAAVSELSGGDAREFLADLLDKPGGYPLDSLRNTYATLRARGRFLPAIPAAAPAPKAAASASPATTPGAPESATHGIPAPRDIKL